jgi:NitT/TauT family transport system ATP-binding protein
MPAAAPLIQLHHVDKRFPTGLLALSDVSLAVRGGEFVALLGPSGCGKSTVLRLAAGLDAPSAGTVQSPAVASGHRADHASTTAFVFQEPTLMPWATVADNVWLPLRLQGHSRAQALPAVQAVLARVGLADFADAHPQQLSGGMKMRASIARARRCWRRCRGRGEREHRDRLQAPRARGGGGQHAGACRPRLSFHGGCARHRLSA